MKYCSKCGNPMADDMLFCQKCGTKFEDSLVVDDSIGAKINSLKSYNLIIDSRSFDWKYTYENVKNTLMLGDQQVKICEEFTKELALVVKEVEGNDIYERELYLYVFSLCYNMCYESLQASRDDSELMNRINIILSAVRQGQCSSKKASEWIYNADVPFLSLVGIQGRNATTIMKALNPEVVWGNMEFQSEALKVAQVHTKLLEANNKRKEDAMLGGIGQELAETWRNDYEDILDYILQENFSRLDEHFWKQLSFNKKDKSFSDKFWTKAKWRNESRKERQKAFFTKRFFEQHPEKEELFNDLDNSLKMKKSSLEKSTRELTSINSEIDSQTKKITNTQRVLSDNGIKIERLSKKIFGRKKAEEEITWIQKSNENLRKEIEECQVTINALKTKKSQAATNLSKLKNEIQHLQDEINALFKEC